MIHLVVSINHLRDVFEMRQGFRFYDWLYSALEPVFGKPVQSVNSVEELGDLTVYELLRTFHQKVVDLLHARAPQLIEKQRDQMTQTARDTYHQPTFVASEANAAASLSLHGLFPHGHLRKQTVGAKVADESHSKEELIPVFLPDFSLATRLYEDFPDNYFWFLNRGILPHTLYEGLDSPVSGTPPLGSRFPDILFGAQPYSQAKRSALASIDGTIENLSSNQRRALECHLCDTIKTVYLRALSYWKDPSLRGACGVDSQMAEQMIAAHENGEAILVVGGISTLLGHQSLRAYNPEIPAVGHHPMLLSASIRQGVARPIVSSLFPIQIWEQCTGTGLVTALWGTSVNSSWFTSRAEACPSRWRLRPFYRDDTESESPRAGYRLVSTRAKTARSRPYAPGTAAKGQPGFSKPGCPPCRVRESHFSSLFFCPAGDKRRRAIFVCPDRPDGHY